MYLSTLIGKVTADIVEVGRPSLLERRRMTMKQLERLYSGILPTGMLVFMLGIVTRRFSTPATESIEVSTAFFKYGLRQ